jgi:hypothetical protein
MLEYPGYSTKEASWLLIYNNDIVTIKGQLKPKRGCPHNLWDNLFSV